MSNTEKKPTVSTSESDTLGDGSADAIFDKMLSDPLEESMVIDFSGKENDLDSLVEPLEDLAESELINSKSEEPEKKAASTVSNQWKAVFSTEEELAHHQQIAASISQDSTQSVGSEQTILDEKDISTLLKGELLEPQAFRPVTPNDGQALSPSAFAAEADLICRVISCLHFERDRKVTVQAEKIVQECQFHHGRGDKRYQNLARSIFDRLVQLLGAPKFNEIYHRAHYMHPRGPPPPQARYPLRFPPVQPHCNIGPSNIELAIAYGIHIARSTNGSEPTSQVVQHGMVALNSMTPKERIMFWNYITSKQGPS